jgi:hypothetical protein
MRRVHLSLAAFLIGLSATLFCETALAEAAGQWFINSDLGAQQQICILNDGDGSNGTWYGTTYNWSGYWTTGMNGRLLLFGNYAVNGQPFGYGNDTITQFSKNGARWYDWYDDNTYAFFGGEIAFERVKSNCDRPYTGPNTKPPSQ